MYHNMATISILLIDYSHTWGQSHRGTTTPQPSVCVWLSPIGLSSIFYIYILTHLLQQLIQMMLRVIKLICRANSYNKCLPETLYLFL